ncbi:MAG: CoA transferase, partial [Halobacteriales archaeon]|nr:CoA transferase [Halobacteriales archaeon]
VNDPRFATNGDRVEHRDSLAEIIKPILAEVTAEDWFTRFRAADVPAAPVRDTVQVFEDPQIREGPVTSDLTIDGIDLPFVELPVIFSGTSTGTERPPPTLGEHTEAVLSTILSQEEVSSLMEGRS